MVSGRYIYANSNQIEEDASPAPVGVALACVAPITQKLGLDWTWTPNLEVVEQRAVQLQPV